MSEQDQEPGEDFGVGDTPDQTEADQPPEEEGGDQTPQEAADVDGSAELAAKADKATDAYHKKIHAIFGDNAPKLQCPTCSGRGLVWSNEEPVRKLKHPPELVACERCDGEGEVETGSKNPVHASTICTACNGTGWKVAAAQPENVTPIVPAAPPASAPVMGFMGPDGVFQPLGQPQSAQGVG